MTPSRFSGKTRKQKNEEVAAAMEEVKSRKLIYKQHKIKKKTLKVRPKFEIKKCCGTCEKNFEKKNGSGHKCKKLKVRSKAEMNVNETHWFISSLKLTRKSAYVWKPKFNIKTCSQYRLSIVKNNVIPEYLEHFVNGNGFVLFSEQGLESTHKKFNEFWKTKQYKIKITKELFSKRLYDCVSAYNMQKFKILL